MLNERDYTRLNYLASSITANPKHFHYYIAIFFNYPVEGELRLAVDALEEELYVEHATGQIVRDPPAALASAIRRLFQRGGPASTAGAAINSSYNVLRSCWLVRK